MPVLAVDDVGFVAGLDHDTVAAMAAGIEVEETAAVGHRLPGLVEAGPSDVGLQSDRRSAGLLQVGPEQTNRRLGLDHGLAVAAATLDEGVADEAVDRAGLKADLPPVARLNVAVVGENAHRLVGIGIAGDLQRRARGHNDAGALGHEELRSLSDDQLGVADGHRTVHEVRVLATPGLVAADVAAMLVVLSSDGVQAAGDRGQAQGKAEHPAPDARAPLAKTLTLDHALLLLVANRLAGDGRPDALAGEVGS